MPDAVRGKRRWRLSRHRQRALDEAAAEHARLPVGRIVEHAGLSRRDAVLAVDQFDHDAAAAAHQPGRLRRAGRAHLDEDLAPAGIERLVETALAEPVDVAQRDPARAQRLARADDDPPRRGIEPHHIERLAGGDAEAPPLADGEMDDAVMAAEHAAVEIDDVAGIGRARHQLLDHVGIAALRHEADVLAVVLVGDRQPEAGAPARASPPWCRSPSGKRRMSSCSRVVANRK